MKFGNKEHMESLRDGKLYCRHLSYYASLENREAHFHDSMEALQAQYPADEVQLMLGPKDGHFLKIDATNGLIGFFKIGWKIRQPAFCLYTIHLGEWENQEITADNRSDFIKSLSISSKMQGFGNHKPYVWVVLDSSQFNARIKQATERLGIKVMARSVDYRPIKDNKFQ